MKLVVENPVSKVIEKILMYPFLSGEFQTNTEQKQN
jgi:hypothetical protein